MERTMNAMAKLAGAAVMAAAMGAGGALADDRKVVEAFYTEVLSRTAAADVGASAEKYLAPGWQSYADNSASFKTREQFIAQLGGFGKLMPDLKWVPQQILKDGNTYIVRSRFTGTPKGPLFGVDGGGKSFEGMSIDIHTLEGGKIAKTYHIEDWAGVLRQLKGQ